MAGAKNVETLTVGADTDAVVVGGGVMGTIAALEMAQQGLAVEVFDRLPEGVTEGNTSYAAGAEFLPFVLGENPKLSVPSIRERLPFQISYLLCTLQGFRESRDYYEQLLDEEGSGIARTHLVEPIDPEHSWEPYLERLMDPSRVRLDQPVRLEGANGNHTEYSEYYSCRTLAIDPLLTLPYLQAKFLEHDGSKWHASSNVTQHALESFEGRPVVVAAGSETSTIHRSMPLLPVYERRGMSARYRTSRPLHLPMVSFDDFVITPHSDGYGFNAGGLDLQNYGHNERRAADAIIRRVIELGETAIGPWEGLPADLLRGSQPEFRSGTRPMGILGLRIQQDPIRPHIISIEDCGSIGWVLAPYAGRLAADYVGEISEGVTQGRPSDSLLLETDIPGTRVVRTSMTDMEQHPSDDLLHWRAHTDDTQGYKGLLKEIAGLVIEEVLAIIDKREAMG